MSANIHKNINRLYNGDHFNGVLYYGKKKPGANRYDETRQQGCRRTYSAGPGFDWFFGLAFQPFHLLIERYSLFLECTIAPA
jgi:hypothetical protein